MAKKAYNSSGARAYQPSERKMTIYFHTGRVVSARAAGSTGWVRPYTTTNGTHRFSFTWRVTCWTMPELLQVVNRSKVAEVCSHSQLKNSIPTAAKPKITHTRTCRRWLQALAKYSNQNHTTSTPNTTNTTREENNARPNMLATKTPAATRRFSFQYSTAQKAIAPNVIRKGSRICELPSRMLSG